MTGNLNTNQAHIMKSFKTELYRVSFDQNDIKKIVHIEHIKSEEVQSFFSLPLVVAHVVQLDANWKLSKKEAMKIIIKASEWLIK
jgi:hypothetical protein